MLVLGDHNDALVVIELEWARSPYGAYRIALVPQRFSQFSSTTVGACLCPAFMLKRAPVQKHVALGTEESIVTNTLQKLSRIQLGTASATLTLMLVLGLVVTQSAQAQTFTDVYNFTGSSDGGYPYAGLVRDAAGNFYGTTAQGGSSGFGVVFKVDTSGAETVLHSFKGGSDGETSFAGLIQDSAGNLYGTTIAGGISGYGIVFKVNTAGKETVLYTFKGGTTDGCGPSALLLRDTTGNLYGTTGVCGSSNYGTVFKLSKSGKETVLHSFSGGSSDGQYPYYGALIIDKEGNLYGVTDSGGAFGSGTLFKLSKSGKVTLLHSFAGGTTDGSLPFGGPVTDKDGNLYGTADDGGSSNSGIVWKISKKGKETVLHNFAGGSSDGANPIAGVILDAKGNLYGQTSGGGTSGDGTVYKLNTKGTLTLLHSFDGSDGKEPWGGLVVRDTKGNLYGTAVDGGTGSYGTVWQITK
jgi:uncharacterized repeat protein (TIGR03803 family)